MGFFWGGGLSSGVCILGIVFWGLSCRGGLPRDCLLGLSSVGLSRGLSSGDYLLMGLVSSEGMSCLLGFVF